MYHFLDVIILMTEINHAHLRIMLPKEWFLNIYFILDTVTDKGKCLVWSFHGGFGIHVIALECGLVSSAFGWRRWTLAPKGLFQFLSMLWQVVHEGGMRSLTCAGVVNKFARVIVAP